MELLTSAGSDPQRTVLRRQGSALSDEGQYRLDLLLGMPMVAEQSLDVRQGCSQRCGVWMGASSIIHSSTRSISSVVGCRLRT